jgi:ribosomal protein S18 acetylase RimI-like enzyme
VRRFVDLRALSGSALVEDGEVAGYMYYVLEEDKALIGDLYVRREVAHGGAGEPAAGIGAGEPIMANSFIGRIESQLMMAGLAPARGPRRADYLSVYERNFMRWTWAAPRWRKGNVRRPMYMEKWSDHYQDAAAQAIAAAYVGHIDSRINDQYRSGGGARRFLYNITQSPGCGVFFRPASYVALEAVSGRLCGISLASLVAPGCGHITQICVTPSVRGTGIGHALLRQSLITPAGGGLPLGEPHGDGRQRRRRGAVRAGGIPDGETVPGVRVGRVLRATRGEQARQPDAHRHYRRRARIGYVGIYRSGNTRARGLSVQSRVTMARARI